MLSQSYFYIYSIIHSRSVRSHQWKLSRSIQAKTTSNSETREINGGRFASEISVANIELSTFCVHLVGQPMASI